MAAKFHKLKVCSVERITPDAVCIGFEVPEKLQQCFRFKPGQYLTLRAEIDGNDIRRSYSICSSPASNRLEVGIRHVEGGRFSGFANGEVKVGDTIEVMEPEGRFAVPDTDGHSHDYLMLAAGSGITPILSIARAVLEEEEESRITLVFGNRETRSVMFREAVDDLKDLNLERFRVIHVLSRERTDVEMFHGRVGRELLKQLTDNGVVDPLAADAVFLCGPAGMIDEAQAFLVGMGVSEDRILLERFTPADDVPAAKPSDAVKKAVEKGVPVEVILDGVHRNFMITDAGQSVLDAAAQSGLELPFSCAGGMCATCRCRVVEGEAEMAVNYSLQGWELEAGFVLACQSRPLSDKLVLDFDSV